MARDFFVSPQGDDSHSGDSSSPWRTIDVACRRAVAGDRIIIRSGVYGATISPVNSGTPDQRIRFVADGAVTIDGGERPTDWRHVGDKIFEATFAGPALGVWQDSFETAGHHCSLWNMGLDNNYNSNPNHELHDFNESHDWDGSHKKHDWRSQFKQFENTLRVRTRDGESPAAHDVRVAVRQHGVLLRDRKWITIEGVQFRHLRVGCELEDAVGIELPNCDFRYLGAYGLVMHRSGDVTLSETRIWGGGSAIAHSGDGTFLKDVERVTFKGCDLAYGGHTVCYIESSSRVTIRDSRLHHSGGAVLAPNRDANDCLFEHNQIHHAITAEEAYCHKSAHAAIQMKGNRNTIRGNVLHTSGAGLSIGGDDQHQSTFNIIEQNTIAGIAEYSVELNGYNNPKNLTGNVIRKNVIAGRGLGELVLRLNGGVDTWGNRIEGNVIQPGGNVYLEGRGFVPVSQAGAAAPGTFVGNRIEDPRLAADYSSPVNAEGIGASVSAAPPTPPAPEPTPPEPVPTPPTPPTPLPLPPGATPFPTDFERRVITLTNAEREKAGRKPLVHHPELRKAADDYAEYMEREGFISHTGPDGSTPGTRARKAGYMGSVGENLGFGQPDPEFVVRRWMESSGHRSNLLNPGWVHIGVGHAEETPYWVQLFGAGEPGNPPFEPVPPSGPGTPKPEPPKPEPPKPEPPKPEPPKPPAPQPQPPGRYTPRPPKRRLFASLLDLLRGGRS